MWNKPGALHLCWCALEPSDPGQILSLAKLPALRVPSPLRARASRPRHLPARPPHPPLPDSSSLAAGGLRPWEVAKCGRRSPKLEAQALCSLPSTTLQGWVPVRTLKALDQNQHFPKR